MDHPRRGLAKCDGALTAKVLGSVLVDEPNGDLVAADFRSQAAHPKNQVGPEVHRRKPRHPHVLEHAQHREFTVLVDQGVVRQHGEVDMHVSSVCGTHSGWG